MIETTAQDKSEKLFHVYLRDGRTFAVSASTFARQIASDDVIKFVTSDGDERDDVFLRAPDTSAIAPESSSVLPQPLVALQNDVEGLKIRVDNIENNLGEIITRAVAEAFSQRGF